ncbi:MULTISPECIES: VOC family protein [unclassified Streptomyces]|uniref:VOC family protein n=1 Tax=unclassified Streptomyces TaxID=2593676 RepID=UPI002E0D541E|nr:MULTISPECIES: VOC family protein [unclassified Streptomyces]WSR24628.1 VOC family protein [Streptomyces sp. NBC_01205]
MSTHEADQRAVQTVPDRYRTAVVPHIMVADAPAALSFYRRAFDAVEDFRLDHPEGGVLHAEVRIAGATLMLGDVSEGPFSAPPALGGTSAALHVFVPDVDALVRTAVAEGAELLQPPTDQFHGDRTAILRDPFGHLWVFLTHLEDVSQDELEGRLAGG